MGEGIKVYRGSAGGELPNLNGGITLGRSGAGNSMSITCPENSCIFITHTNMTSDPFRKNPNAFGPPSIILKNGVVTKNTLGEEFTVVYRTSYLSISRDSSNLWSERWFVLLT